MLKNDDDKTTRYEGFISLIKEYDQYQESSNYFDIAVEMAKIDNGYRYYITIDNPRIALYDVEALAIESDVDYDATMAANVGIFEETEYNMIPNQHNVDKGYVEGIVMSATCDKSNTTLYILVQWKNADFTITHRECFCLDCAYGD